MTRTITLPATWTELKTDFVHSYRLRCGGSILATVWRHGEKWHTMNHEQGYATMEEAMGVAEGRLAGKETTDGTK